MTQAARGRGERILRPNCRHRIIDIRPHYSYIPSSLLARDAFRKVCRKVEQVRRPRADLPPAPGQLWVVRPTGITTGRREASLYRDRQAKGKARRRPHPG